MAKAISHLRNETWRRRGSRVDGSFIWYTEPMGGDVVPTVSCRNYQLEIRVGLECLEPQVEGQQLYHDSTVFGDAVDSFGDSKIRKMQDYFWWPNSIHYIIDNGNSQRSENLYFGQGKASIVQVELWERILGVHAFWPKLFVEPLRLKKRQLTNRRKRALPWNSGRSRTWQQKSQPQKRAHWSTRSMSCTWCCQIICESNHTRYNLEMMTP